MNLTETQQNEKAKKWNWNELLVRCELEEAEGDENFGLEVVEDASSDYEFGQKAEISKYLLLNKGLRSFRDEYLRCSEEELGKKTDMRGFEAYKEVLTHKKKLDQGRFKWERWSDSLDKVCQMIHRYNKIGFPLYPQIVDAEIFQLVFPVDLIQSYMYSPFFGDYLKDAEFKPVLKLQTDLARLFLLFHLKADTKYLSRIDSDQLGIMDPFSRNYMRFKNRLDPLFGENGKYNSDDFEIKEYLVNALRYSFNRSDSLK
jgi:hypothetical protein